MGILEDNLDRQPVGQPALCLTRILWLAAERRFGNRHGDLDFPFDAVGSKELRQLFIRGIHIIRGKRSFRAGDIHGAITIWFATGPFFVAPEASNRTTRVALLSTKSGLAVYMTAGMVTPAGFGFAAFVSNAMW